MMLVVALLKVFDSLTVFLFTVEAVMVDWMVIFVAVMINSVQNVQ
jgi:hypothetical protein